MKACSLSFFFFFYYTPLHLHEQLVFKRSNSLDLSISALDCVSGQGGSRKYSQALRGCTININEMHLTSTKLKLDCNLKLKIIKQNNIQTKHTKGSLSLLLELSIALSLGLADGSVSSNAGGNVVVAVALLHVLNSHVDPLAEVLAPHSLQHLNSDSTGGNIPHLTSLSVVDSVGHTTVHGGVGLDVDDFSEVVVHQVSREVGETMLAESLGKLMPGLSSKTVSARHLL